MFMGVPCEGFKSLGASVHLSCLFHSTKFRGKAANRWHVVPLLNAHDLSKTQDLKVRSHDGTAVYHSLFFRRARDVFIWSSNLHAWRNSVQILPELLGSPATDLRLVGGGGSISCSAYTRSRNYPDVKDNSASSPMITPNISAS